VAAVNLACQVAGASSTSAIFVPHAAAKVEPLKAKGRMIVDFKTPDEGQAALEVVLAVNRRD